MDVDVAVVGCGPVGATLATLLGKRGHRVVVLERHEAPYQLPRAVHFDHEVARILQSCGLGAQLPEISEPGSEYEWRSGTGQVLLRLGGRPVGPSGWPDSNMFWQPALEALLETAAAAQPGVEIHRGRSVVALDDGTDGVTLTIDPAGGGPAERLTARYVVGCDGANSTIRDLMATSVTDLGFFYDWLIVDVVLHEARVFNPINLQMCEPARPTTIVSGGPGRRRWEFMRLPHETIDQLDDVDRAWELLAPWDVSPANAVLERHAVYRFQARWADEWRRGRVLIAGDAAHQMPPFAGQGMCAGIRDAANLAWKLDLVLGHDVPGELLDTYAAERADNVRAVIDMSMELGRIICITDPDEAAQRDEFMVEMAGDGGAQPQPPLPGVTVGVIADDPLAGSLFIQGRLERGGRIALADDLVGGGWRVVTVDPVVADLPVADLEWFATLGGEVVVIEPSADIDGTYSDWFAHHGVVAVLQRPDFHLFGSAVDPASAAHLITALRHALATSTPGAAGYETGVIP